MLPSDKVKHQGFILDIKATKASNLWPKSNGMPPSNCNIVAMWQSINIFVPKLESY